MRGRSGGWATTDLCDAHEDEVRVALPGLRDFGGVRAFCGPIRTVRVHEDNVLVKEALAGPGDGAVLVVDGGGSGRCALLGDRLAALGAANGWSGVVVHGCVRDSRELAEIALGVKALGTSPRRSWKRGEGERDVPVGFCGTLFEPGWLLFADEDGILLAPRDLRAAT